MSSFEGYSSSTGIASQFISDNLPVAFEGLPTSFDFLFICTDLASGLTSGLASGLASG